MKRKIIYGLIGVAFIGGVWFLVAGHSSNQALDTVSLPTEIYYSDHGGTISPDEARSHTIDMTRDASGTITAFYELKDGRGTTLSNETLSVSGPTFTETLAAARNVSLAQPAGGPCLGGSGKELSVRIGSTTSNAYSVSCGPGTLNQSLEAFYSNYLAPLVVGLPSK